MSKARLGGIEGFFAASRFAANLARCVIGIVALMTASMTVAQAQPIVANFDFEQAVPTDSSVRIPSWNTVGTPQGVSLDSVKPFAGKSSVSITTTDPSRPSGIWQAITTTLTGGYYRVSAQLASDSLNSGVAGIWLRYQLPGESRPVFVSSYSERLAVNGQWSQRSIYAAIPANAQGVSIGANVAGVGHIWVDNFEMSTIPLDGTRRAAKPVGEFLDDAITKIRNSALNASKVKWDEVINVAYAITGATDRIEDAYPAINLVLRSLEDRHSHLLPRVPTAGSTTPPAPGFGSFPPVNSKLVGNSLYLEVPAFVGGDESAMKGFSSSLSSKLSIGAEPATCGLILDLRRNTGGNMWPALHALRHTLDTKEPGYFVYRDGTRKGWSSNIADDEQDKASATSRWEKAPIAILIGPRTASSGEALLVAYRGRANTRSFGAATAGQSTGNTPFMLTDGSTIAVTTSTLADRTGKTYGMQMEPDERIEMVASAPGGDLALQAAAKWLELQTSACPPSAK